MPYRLSYRKIIQAAQLVQNQYQCRYQTQSLQSVGPHQRLYASPESVQPNQENRSGRRNLERNAHASEHIILQNQAH